MDIFDWGFLLRMESRQSQMCIRKKYLSEMKQSNTPFDRPLFKPDAAMLVTN